MPKIIIQDRQTKEKFRAPTGTTFDESKYELVGSEGYEGPPDLPLETGAGDVSDKTAALLLRILGPTAGAMMGPAGFLASLGTNAAVGAGTEAAARAAEGEPFSAEQTGLGGVKNAAIGAAARPIGALGSVAAHKLGLGTKPTGTLNLSGLRDVADDAANAKGLVGGRVSGAGEKIREWLTASGGTLPVSAPGLKPSAETIRRGIPWRQPGGKELYGTLRDSIKGQNPDYDRLLQQYHSMHALTDKLSFKELLGAMLLGGGGGLGMGAPGVGLAVAPRLLNAAQAAPPARALQAGMAQPWTDILRALLQDDQ